MCFFDSGAYNLLDTWILSNDKNLADLIEMYVNGCMLCDSELKCVILALTLI